MNLFLAHKSSCLRVKRLLIVTFGFFFPGQSDSMDREKIGLQHAWKHQFQFAGYYAALEKGFYEEAGFDVEIREASQSINTIDEILNGNAQFAISDAEILIYYLKGKPIVLLASIFQHSPSVMMVKANSNIYTPQDAVGKTLMLGEDLNGLEILTLLYSEGLRKEQFNVVPQSFSVNELLGDKVDVLGAYISNEPYFMEKFGIPYRIINPISYGIDFYSDCIYCSSKLLKSKPEKVKKFREASIKGWEYALANQEEIAQLIVSKYNQSKTIDHLLYEANEIKKLINPDFIEIGHTNKWRWQKIGEYLYQQGMIDHVSNLDDFIYSPDQTSKYLWIKALVIIAISFLLVAGLFVLFHLRLTRSVEQRTKHIQSLVEKLEDQNAEIQRINIDLIKARELAKESDESRFFFFSKIINELRSPVKSLVDLTEQISKPNISGEKKQAVCSRIIYNSRIVFDFINDIIAIANVDDKNINTSLGEVNIKEFLNNLVTTMQNENRMTSRISLTLDVSHISENLDQNILVDHDRLSRILLKLINNAFKFTESGIIEVGCERNSPNSLIVWVKDTGHGIKPDILKKINDFFYDPKQTNSNGIGLGLWVCKNLAQQMKGSLWVESDTEKSKGSKFFIQVPCIYFDHTDFNLAYINHNKNSLQQIQAEKLKGKTLVILDKHIDNYNLIKLLIKGTGFKLLYIETIND